MREFLLAVLNLIRDSSIALGTWHATGVGVFVLLVVVLSRRR